MILACPQYEAVRGEMFNKISELNAHIPIEQIVRIMLGVFYADLTFTDLTQIWLISSEYVCRMYADILKSR